MTRILALVLAFVSFPALADEACPPGTHTIADDKALVLKDGAEYLGILRMPFTDKGAAVFYHMGDLTYLSPVINGCVLAGVVPVGRFRAEQSI